MGACTGFLSGLLGIGGGMIMVPFVDALLRQQGLDAEHSLRMAIATSLATILFTSLSSMRAHHRRGGVRWDVAKQLLPGILLGSALGAYWASQLQTRWLLAWFAAFLLFSATQMLIERKPKASRGLPSQGGLTLVGSLIGGLSSGAHRLQARLPQSSQGNARILDGPVAVLRRPLGPKDSALGRVAGLPAPLTLTVLGGQRLPGAT
ncbi:MAG: hypothetical protein RLY65_1994, partial [Pseudomonadota bacterium]